MCAPGQAEHDGSTVQEESGHICYPLAEDINVVVLPIKAHCQEVCNELNGNLPATYGPDCTKISHACKANYRHA